MSEYTTLQSHVHRALMDGVSPAMESYLLSQNWEKDDIKKLAFSLTFFNRAFRSPTTKEHETNLQYLVSTLTIHKGMDCIMPELSTTFQGPAITKFLQDKKAVKSVARAAFDSDEYKYFKHKVSKPSVPTWDLGGIDFKVKHICPSGNSSISNFRLIGFAGWIVRALIQPLNRSTDSNVNPTV